jgi:hypothetical protein
LTTSTPFSVRQHAGGLQDLEADGRRVGLQHLVELFGDALLAQDLDAVGLRPHCVEHAVGHPKLELRGKAGGPDHAEGVVLERVRRVEGRVDGLPLQVAPAVERVEEGAEAVRREVDRHRVDRKVAAVLVVLQRAGLHLRLSGVGAVALLAGGHKLQDERVVRVVVGERVRGGDADRGGAELGVDVCGAAAEGLAHRLGQCDAGLGPDGDEVEVRGGAAQEHVAHHAAHGVRLDALPLGHAPDRAQDRLVGNVPQPVGQGVDVSVGRGLRHAVGTS